MFVSQAGLGRSWLDFRLRRSQRCFQGDLNRLSSLNEPNGVKWCRMSEDICCLDDLKMNTNESRTRLEGIHLYIWSGTSWTGTGTAGKFQVSALCTVKPRQYVVVLQQKQQSHKNKMHFPDVWSDWIPCCYLADTSDSNRKVIKLPAMIGSPVSTLDWWFCISDASSGQMSPSSSGVSSLGKIL